MTGKLFLALVTFGPGVTPKRRWRQLAAESDAGGGACGSVS